MSTELLQALSDLGKEKGIEPEVILEAVEAALISAYKKNFGSAQNVQVVIDQVTGDFHVYTCYDVVEEVNNEKRDKASVSNLVGACFIGRGNDLPWEK